MPFYSLYVSEFSLSFGADRTIANLFVQVKILTARRVSATISLISFLHYQNVDHLQRTLI